MGSERHDEDPHERPRHPPKLTLVGRLAGTLDGRPWSLNAEAGTVALKVTGFSSLFKARVVLREKWYVLSPFVSSVDVPIRIKCGPFPTVSISTRSRLFRLLMSGSLTQGRAS